MTKALSRVLTTWSCNLLFGSKSSTQVISWWSRWRSTSLLPVDCEASLEELSERTRPKVPSSRVISSILSQSVKSSKVSCCLDSPSIEVLSLTNDWGVPQETIKIKIKLNLMIWDMFRLHRKNEMSKFWLSLSLSDSTHWVKWEKFYLMVLVQPELDWAISELVNMSTDLLCMLKKTHLISL